MTPTEKLTPDRNFVYIMTRCPYSAKMKLQYMKNIFHVANFHINLVFSMRNMFKEVNVIKSRGALGTGFTYAPVLLFELYLAVNNSSTSHSPLGILLPYALLLSTGNTPALRVSFEPAVNRQRGFRRWDS